MGDLEKLVIRCSCDFCLVGADRIITDPKQASPIAAANKRQCNDRGTDPFLAIPDDQHLDPFCTAIGATRAPTQGLKAEVAMDLSELCPVELERMAASFAVNPQFMLGEEIVDPLD